MATNILHVSITLDWDLTCFWEANFCLKYLDLKIKYSCMLHARNFCISSWCVRSDTLGSYNCGNALTHTYIYMYVMCRNSKFALAMARRKLYIRFPQSWNENVTMLASQPGKPYFSGGWWKLIRMRYYMCTYATTTFIKT